MNRSKLILALAVASQVGFSLITFGLPSIGSDIRSQWHLGPAGFGAVFAAVGVGSAVALIPAGMLVDRLGARRVLIAGGLVNAGGLTAAAFASSGLGFGGALFVAGVGGSAVPVAGMTSLLREFEPTRRGLALGLRQLAVPLGGTVGSVLLPALVAVGGVRAAMLGASAAAGLTALAFATVVGDDRSERPSRGLDGLLRLPRMRPLLLLGLLYVSALGAVLTFYAQAVHSAGLSPGLAVFGFAALNITAALSRVVWGLVADLDGGSGRLRALRLTGIVAALSAVAMPFALAVWSPLGLAVTLPLAFGVFGFNGVLYLIAGEIAGADRAGRAVGVASTVVFGWGALSAPLAGLVIEQTGFGAVWVIAAVTCTAGVAVTVAMGRSTIRDQDRILDSWGSAGADRGVPGD